MSSCVFSRVSVLFLLVSALCAQDSPSSPAAATTLPDLLKNANKAYYSGKFESAIQSYQSAIQQDPKSAEAYAGLTRVYLKQEKVELAAQTANQGILQAPQAASVHTVLGEVYFRQGKMQEAEVEFLTAINSPPPDPRACLGLSRFYDAYSLHARARSMLNRAHELAPDDPEILRRWIATRKRSEKIKWLRNKLAGATHDDADEGRGIHEWLAFLEGRESQPHSSCKLVTNLSATETEIMRLQDPSHFHGYGLNVGINGRSTHLELDTGASGLLINKSFAEKVGIKPVSSIHIIGVGDQGAQSGFVGYADSIKIGHLEFQHCLVEVSDRFSNLPVDGLIGANVFSQYLVTIDFPDLKLRLEQLPVPPGQTRAPINLATEELEDVSVANDEDEVQPPDSTHSASSKAQAVDQGPSDAYVAPEMKSYTKVFRFGHSLLIPTKVGDASSKLFLIDTGAMFNNISPDAAREVTRIHGNSSLKVKGISGNVNKVYEADKAVVQFSHFRQENFGLITFDLSSLSHAVGTEVSGILGLQVLRGMIIKIDYRDGLVDFVYKGPRIE